MKGDRGYRDNRRMRIFKPMIDRDKRIDSPKSEDDVECPYGDGADREIWERDREMKLREERRGR